MITQGKLFAIVGIVTALAVAGTVVFGLARGAYLDFITGIENQTKLEEAQKQTEKLVKQQAQDMIAIKRISESNVVVITGILESIKETDDKFTKLNKSTGKNRDTGVLLLDKPYWVARIMSKGANNMNRCFALIMGAELTEDERNANKKSQYNSECPELANPNSNEYRDYWMRESEKD